ncbi:hypothetical protein G7K_0373-t1 [Saitoella complicata NRRL Y-17804]|uniref:Uncharacterized protein n=1 Tax=Saitoella complicata (strain BCRC 22490 / CBS 7301 / JCM 7358 / NBRC 10748 / NRRL Y-17804) TaxID=698492 RepID=A0A0E9N8I3_SAICN|nr:hypothetical protein G7K_0373-t1 [Saitoella complicata NRRL Y-17804]
MVDNVKVQTRSIANIIQRTCHVNVMHYQIRSCLCILPRPPGGVRCRFTQAYAYQALIFSLRLFSALTLLFRGYSPGTNPTLMQRLFVRVTFTSSAFSSSSSTPASSKV